VLPAFEYLAPTSVKQASLLLAKFGENAKIIAGGTDLLVSMKEVEAFPHYVVGIGQISTLRGIDFSKKKGLVVGAGTTVGEIEDSRTVRENYPFIHEAASTLGSVQVRNMGTIGGNLCNASPAADMAPPLLAAVAEVQLSGLKKRIIPLEDFFMGPGKNVLRKGEILTQIRVPRLPAGTGTVFLKIGRLSMDLAQVNTAVAISMSSRVCKEARIALGAVAPTPIRARRAERWLEGKRLDGNAVNQASDMVVSETKPITDIRSSSEYRSECIRVLVRRAIVGAIERSERLER